MEKEKQSSQINCRKALRFEEMGLDSHELLQYLNCRYAAFVSPKMSHKK